MSTTTQNQLDSAKQLMVESFGMSVSHDGNLTIQVDAHNALILSENTAYISMCKLVEDIGVSVIFEQSFNDDDWYILSKTTKKVVKNLGRLNVPMMTHPESNDIIKSNLKKPDYIAMKGMKAKHAGFVNEAILNEDPQNAWRNRMTNKGATKFSDDGPVKTTTSRYVHAHKKNEENKTVKVGSFDRVTRKEVPND